MEDQIAELRATLGQTKILFQRICELDLEGVVAKHKFAPYVVDRESSTWFKIRNRGYSQMARREELFERKRHKEPVAGWHSCVLAMCRTGIMANNILGVSAMLTSSWQMEKGHLVCRWSEVGKRVPYNPPWMQEASDIQGSYLPPVPDFASHSPFGGPSWFQPHTTDCDPGAK